MKPADLDKLVAMRFNPQAWAKVKNAAVLQKTHLAVADQFITAVAKRMGLTKPPPPWFRCWALGVPYRMPL